MQRTHVIYFAFSLLLSLSGFTQETEYILGHRSFSYTVCYSYIQNNLPKKSCRPSSFEAGKCESTRNLNSQMVKNVESTNNYLKMNAERFAQYGISNMRYTLESAKYGHQCNAAEKEKITETNHFKLITAEGIVPKVRGIFYYTIGTNQHLLSARIVDGRAEVLSAGFKGDVIRFSKFKLYDDSDYELDNPYMEQEAIIDGRGQGFYIKVHKKIVEPNLLPDLVPTAKGVSVNSEGLLNVSWANLGEKLSGQDIKSFNIKYIIKDFMSDAAVQEVKDALDHTNTTQVVTLLDTKEIIARAQARGLKEVTLFFSLDNMNTVEESEESNNSLEVIVEIPQIDIED